MVEPELDRDSDRLRLLIETMQRGGRPEREIETLIREASGRMHRDTSRPSRRLVGFGMRHRARKRDGVSR